MPELVVLEVGYTTMYAITPIVTKLQTSGTIEYANKNIQQILKDELTIIIQRHVKMMSLSEE